MIAVGVLVGAALSVLVQVLAFEPIQRRAADPHKAELQILVGGIGIAIIPLAIAQHITKSVPFGYSAGSFHVVTYDLGFVRVSNVQMVILVAALGLAGAIGWWLRATRAGPGAAGHRRRPRGRLDHGRRPAAPGAAAPWPSPAGLAGLAGVLLTYYLGSIAPETGDGFLLKAFAAIILGGVGSIAGVVVGAMVLAGIETLVLVNDLGLLGARDRLRPDLPDVARPTARPPRPAGGAAHMSAWYYSNLDPHPGDVHQPAAGAVHPGAAAGGRLLLRRHRQLRASAPTRRRSSPSGCRSPRSSRSARAWSSRWWPGTCWRSLVARLSGLYLGMATIAFALFLGVLATNGGELTGGPTGLYGAL